MSAHGEHDDHYPYADAVACALAAVLILFVAAVVNQGAGEETVAAREVFVVTASYDREPTAPPDAIAFNGRPLVTFAHDGRVVTARPGTMFPDLVQRVPDAKLADKGEKTDLRIHTADGSEPALQLVVDSFPRKEWKTTLRVRSDAQTSRTVLTYRFGPGACPAKLVVRYQPPVPPAVTAEFTDFRDGPVEVVIRPDGRGLNVRRGDQP